MSWGAFLLFVGLYGATSQGGIAWQDSGLYQLRAVKGDLVGLMGGASSHPLYMAVAIAFARVWGLEGVTLLSSLAMAGAVGILVRTVGEWTGSRGKGFFAGVLLGVAHLPWWLGTIAESYPLWLLVFALQVRCVLRHRWGGAYFLAGLGVGIHNMSLLTLPGLIVSNRRRWSRFLVGLIPMLAFGWWYGIAPRDLLFGHYEGAVTGLLPTNLSLWGVNIALFGLSLANPYWATALRGAKGLISAREEASRFLLISLLLLTGFFVRYGVADQFMFGLPTLYLLALLVGRGLPQSPRAPAYALTLLLAVCLPIFLAKVTDPYIRRPRTLPGRNEARYWLIPWKHNERSAQTLAEQIRQLPDRNAPFFADATVAPVVEIGGYHPITPHDPLWRIDPHRPSYVITAKPHYCPRFLLQKPYHHRPQAGITLCTP